MTAITLDAATPAIVHPPDFINLYIPSVADVPAGWRWTILDASDTVAPKGFGRVTGSVLTPDGSPVAGTTSTHFIEFVKYRAWITEYCKSLGKCEECWNSGLKAVGWNVKLGTRYEPCKCGANPTRDSNSSPA